jgi:macrolide-specific efflux system membrane fusion protein
MPKKIITSVFQKLGVVKDWYLKRSWTTKTAIIVVLLLVVWFGYKKISAAKQNQPQIQTATVEKGTIVSTVSASGNVVAANTFTIKTSASGVVSKVYVKDGDTVGKGQKIADIILDLDGEQQYAQAYSSYVSAVDSLSNAKNNLRSALAHRNNVYDQIQGHATDESYSMIETRTSAEVAYDNAYNGVKNAEANLTNAQFNLSANSPTITAPNSGVVEGLTIAEGLPLSAQTTSTGTRTGQRIASIVKEGKPLISVNLSEIDVPNVKVGQKATITFDSIADKTFTGVVSAIDRTGSTTSNVTSYPAIITLDSGSDQILPNMATTANIITEVKNDVLLVPIAAVKSVNGQSTVTILTNGQQQTVNVETGISSDTQTEIVSGLTEGEEVVTGTISTSSSSSQSGSVFGGGFGGGGSARFIAR